MLSIEDNEIMCRVGPGTPMGGLMREFWIPALMSSELPVNDGPPFRLRLLGENLIAFRDTNGNVGIFPTACPHRGASMFFGRNEEAGLRCVYHGWKFDVTGACVDMPSEPAESNFKNKVRIHAYPTRERGEVVWVYMGPRELDRLPPLPDIETNMSPPGVNSANKILRECNYVQALEGDIDTSHISFLHRNLQEDAFAATPDEFNKYVGADSAPRYMVDETEYGTIYGAYRPAEEDSYYFRIGQFVLPFYTMPGTGKLGYGGRRGFRAWVPVDDDHTMFFTIGAPRGYNMFGNAATPQPPPDNRNRFMPETTDFAKGRWRLAANAENDYMIDREAQKTVNYTGIGNIHLQDQAITESMGPVYARQNEHLGTSDSMIIRTRRRLIKAAKAHRDEGVIPSVVDHPELYRVRSGGTVIPRNADWLQATADLRRVDREIEEALVLQQAAT
jgi:phenylpropionate dioxygenase-like ring-hydroxylating dioxygenase large terminal subunit